MFQTYFLYFFLSFSLSYSSSSLSSSLSSSFSSSVIEFPLESLQYSYVLSFSFLGESFLGLVDTGDSLMIGINSSLPVSYEKQISCLTRLIDQSLLNVNSSHCQTVSGLLEIQNFSLVINMTIAQDQYVENSLLHPWPNTTGIFGMNYPTNSENVFQLLLSSINSTIFGLDFNKQDQLSTIQISGVSERYKNSLIWSPIQTTETPTDHTFYLHDLTFCEIPVFANWSKNWPVIVDTASVCLSLPAEYYSIFTSWFNSTLDPTMTSLEYLPVFAFSLFPDPEQDEILYIHLSDLLINSSMIQNERGFPELISLPTSMNHLNPLNLSLCILQGDVIDDPRKTDFNVPPIIFGSLVLRSLYFSSNFETYQIGFANKHSFSQSVHSTQCSSPKVCPGQSHLSHYYNACVKPDCAHFYYVTFNSQTGQCEYEHGAYVAGVLFVTLITFLEILTYFTSQYTFFERVYYSSSQFKPDFLTQWIGLYLTWFLDGFIYHVMGWGDDNDGRERRPNEPNEHDEQRSTGGSELFDDDNDEENEQIGVIYQTDDGRILHFTGRFEVYNYHPNSNSSMTTASPPPPLPTTASTGS